MTSKKSSDPTWSDVKAKLLDFDRAGMLRLVQDLYAASKDNQNFLHARFELGNEVLELCKAIIKRWAWPDIDKNQDYSVARAKKPIADYRRAAGRPAGLAELTVFYCDASRRLASATKSGWMMEATTMPLAECSSKR